VEFPKEVSVVPQGSVPEDIEFEQVMLGDTNKTTLVGFLFVIIIASLFYRSIVSGFLAFIPIIFAIIFTVGFMGYIDLPFNVLTTGMLAILMGMGIDFSIHLIHSIEESMEEYKGDASKAFPHALTSTGQAISITTITTILGFLALSFATLVNTHRLGYTLAIGIGATFIACIIIVPTVLSIKNKTRIALIDQHINITLSRFSKHLTFREKLRIVGDVIRGLIFPKKELKKYGIEKMDLSKVPSDKLIRKLIGGIKKRYPNIYRVLIHERNVYMADRLYKIMLSHPGLKVLAVVGAGHKEGMEKILKKKLVSTDVIYSYGFTSS